MTLEEAICIENKLTFVKALYSISYCIVDMHCVFFFFFQAEDGIRDYKVTGVQTCALPICFTVDAAPGEPSLLLGLDVFEAGNEKVLRMLDSSGLLLARHSHKHKYPYDWRTDRKSVV